MRYQVDKRDGDGEQAMQDTSELMNRTAEPSEEGQEVCHCGTPLTQDSCPACGTWNDTGGRR